MTRSKVYRLSDRTRITTGELETVFAGHNDAAAAQIAMLHTAIVELRAELSANINKERVGDGFGKPNCLTGVKR